MITKDVENNTLDSNNDEGVDGRAQSKKEKEKKMLYEATRLHELFAKIFYMAKLREFKTIFP
jgi:hypothetical protein